PMPMVPNQSTGLMSVTAVYAVSVALSSMSGCCVPERLTDTLARIVRRASGPITMCSTMESVMLVFSDVPAMAMRVVASTDCMRTRLAPLREMSPYLGDGLLVYFGWPQAHEDDTRRAVHAGLALVTAVRDLSSELVQDYGIRLAVRLGMHT